jgi:hypothetical protein
MKHKTLPPGFIEQNYGLTACTKLLRQMEIADRRVQEGTQAFAHAVGSHRWSAPGAELEFDAETFYTVAADFLKLAASIIRQPAFTSDAVYKRIQAVRNHLIRHAYEKPDGVAYCGWGFGPDYGPVLKAGSGSQFATKGYFQDHRDLMDFLSRFGATADGMAKLWETMLDSQRKTAADTGTGIASVQ